MLIFGTTNVGYLRSDTDTDVRCLYSDCSVKPHSHCVRHHTWTHGDIWRHHTDGAVRRRSTLQMQNYMLLTVVVSGHSCIAVRRRTATQCVWTLHNNRSVGKWSKCSTIVRSPTVIKG